MYIFVFSSEIASYHYDAMLPAEGRNKEVHVFDKMYSDRQPLGSTTN